MSKNKFDEAIDRIEKKDALERDIQEYVNHPELNSWEDDFMDSLLEQVQKGHNLSDKQQDKFDQIKSKIEFGADNW